MHYEHRIVDENQFYFVLIKNLCMSYTSQFLPYTCLSFYSPTQSLCLSRFFFTSKVIGRTAIQSCPIYSPIRCERVPCVNHANHSRGLLIKNLCMSYTSQFLPYTCLSFYSPTQSLCLSRFFFTSKVIGRTAIQSCPIYSPIRCERVPCVNHANHSRGLLSHVPFFPRLKHLLFT